MSNNFEDFLIRFVFEDKKAVDQLKKLSSHYDRVAKQSKKSSKQEIQSSKKRQRENKAEISQIKEKKRLLRDQITRAKSLGVNTSGFERTLNQAKKVETVERRRKELQDIISKERLRQQSISTTTSKQQLQAEKELARQQRARIQAQERAERNELKRRRARMNKMSSFEMSRNFQTVSKQDPEFAARTYKKALAALNQETAHGDRLFKRYKHRIDESARSMKTAQRRALNLRTAQAGLADSTRNMLRAYASLFVVMEGTGAINQIGQDFEGMRAAMLASSGGMQGAGEDLAFVRKEAVRLGLDLRDATDNFVKFQFAAKEVMSQEDTRALFTGFSEFSTALQLNPQRYEKALTALQQIMNKQQLMAEEVKQQLGEQAPGSIQVFAKALNMTTQEFFKAMEQGELMAGDVLPKVAKEFARTAREGGALTAAMKTARIQQKRFTTGYQEAADKVFQAGFGEGVADLFNELTESLKESNKGIEGVGKIYKLFFDTLRIALRAVIPILDSFLFVAGEVAGVLNKLFVHDASYILAGIAAITLASKRMDLVFKSIYMRLLLIIGAIDEMLAPFVKGRVGILEKAIGKDLSFGESTQSKVESTAASGVLGVGTAQGMALSGFGSRIARLAAEASQTNKNPAAIAANVGSKLFSGTKVERQDVTIQVTGTSDPEETANRTMEAFKREMAGYMIGGQ